MAKVHIDENVKIKSGKAAEEALAKESDLKYLTEDGVVKITKERWKLAQEAESKHWMDLGRGAADDRNHEHSQMFRGYKDLKGKTFNRAAEFGCGPFTNLRIIGQLSTIKDVVLVDPLADRYLKHRHCSYRGGQQLRLDRGQGSGIPISKLLSVPGEQAPDNLQCDLVVCINVLEHCYDAELFYDKLWNACNSGAYFVFHDKLFTYEKAKKSVEDVYDAAHPLRIGKDMTMRFLNRFEKVYEHHHSLRNDMIDATQDMIYYIGRKK